MILSSTAKPGEVIIAAYDMDGSPHPLFAINFDSTSFKESSVLAEQLGSMRELGESGLVRAGKDISNPGLLGTLAMLLETSKVGAVVDVEAIAVPEGLALVEWLKMYPGMGFVVSTRPVRIRRLSWRCSLRRGLTARVIGRITEARRLIIRGRGRRAVLS